MIKVGALLKFLADLNPQKTPGRLSLYNWLKGHLENEDQLTPEVLQKFFWETMDYPHWQAHKSQLGQEVRFLFDQFLKFFHIKFDLSSVQFPEAIQVIELENPSDVSSVLSTYLNGKMQPQEKLKLISDQNKKFYAIILSENRSLQFRVFDKKFTIRNGFIEPLRNDLILNYNSQLELSEEHQHKIEIAPHITAQFSINKNRVTGNIIRGFVFQKMSEMTGEPLHALSRLHLPIRRFEQFFIDRRSDQDYQDLLQKLERTQALISAKDPDAIKGVSTLLAQAENSLEQVYIGDRLLSLLIRDLKHTLPNLARSDARRISNDPEELVSCHTLIPIEESDLTN